MKPRAALFKFVFVLSASLLTTSTAFSNCGLGIVASDLNLDWDLNWTRHSISILITKTDPGACTFGLTFSKGGAGSYSRAATGTTSLRYQLYQDSSAVNVLKEVPDLASVNDVIMVTMGAGVTSQNVTYYFDIPYATATTPALATAGTYTDTFSISAYEGADPTLFANPPDATANVNVSIAVGKIIALAFVDTGGVFQESATTKTVNLGNLTTGKTSRFDIRLRTNAGHEITVTSTNAGRLKHSTKNSYVPYTMSVNNTSADMSGVTPVVGGSGSSTLAGLGYPVKIVIGTAGTLPLAGTFSDSVVVTATTTE